MKRWPYIPLALALTSSLAVVFVWRAPEPALSIQPTETDGLTEAAPEVVFVRLYAKRLIAQEVAAGRRPLVEAAALFRELNRLSPESSEYAAIDMYPWALSAPAHTEDERLCRQVVQWVQGLWVSESVDYADAAVARLNVEFREERDRRGTIRLPNPSSLPPVQELLKQARKAMTPAERQSLRRPRQDAVGQ